MVELTETLAPVAAGGAYPTATRLARRRTDDASRRAGQQPEPTRAAYPGARPSNGNAASSKAEQEVASAEAEMLASLQSLQALNAELAAPDPKLDDLSDEELARLQAEVPRPPFPA